MKKDELFSALFTFSPDPSWIIDEGLFIECNEAAVKSLNYSSVEELAKTHPSKLSPELQPCGESSFNKANEMIKLALEKGLHRFEWIHKKKTGESFPVEVTLSTIKLAGKEVLYCIWRDVTEQKKMIEELKFAKLNSESSSQSKSLFISNVSHEMRTPLNLILGETQVLMEEVLDEVHKKQLNNIMISGETLLELISDLLDISKIEAGEIIISEGPFSIRDEVGKLTKMLRRKAEEKGILFDIVIDDNVNSHYFGDSGRVRQVLLNFIGNALKFTEKGGSIIVLITESADKSVKFEVTDSGIGISEEHQAHLFERFHQIDSTHTRKYGGTGLGLNICKRLVELMGGDISFSSSAGRGSVFAFCLPLKRATDSDLSLKDDKTELEYEKCHPDKVLKILAVDDSVENLYVLELFFKKTKHTLITCTSGQEGINHFENSELDLILMDIQMPEMDGYEAIGKIRLIEKELEKDVTIMALTAHATSEEVNKCLAAGADLHYAKPIIKAPFLDTLCRYFKKLP